MEINLITKQLQYNKSVFQNLFKSFDNEESQKYKAAENKWCALEILCHLYDEEREDFRARIDHILSTNEDALMPGINPEAWAKEREYMKQSFDNKLDKFLAERDNSIRYIESNLNANWQRKFIHPFLKEVDPYFFLKNWLAHDYLHIRQIIKLKYDYLYSKDSYITLDYAGSW